MSRVGLAEGHATEMRLSTARHMRRSMIVVLGLGLIASPCRAQLEPGPPRVEGFVAGGVAFPVSDFADRTKVGGQVSVGAGFYVVPRVAVGAEIGFQRHDAEDVAKDYDVSRFLGTLKFRFFDGHTTPFVAGGVGLVDSSFEVPDEIEDFEKSNQEWGYALAAGVQTLVRGRFGSLAEVSWTLSPNDSDPDIQFVTVRLGLTVALGEIDT